MIDKKFPHISSSVKEKDILNLYENNFHELSIPWFELMMEWMSMSYQNFKDHEKYLILIYLISRTFDFYSKNFITINYEKFYELKKVEIQKFSVTEISKKLNISKETARRKIMELEKIGIITKHKKKLLINKNAFDIQKPEKILKIILSFLNRVSKISFANKVISREITTEEFSNCILKNFSHAWKLWYQMLIPNLLSWKNIHKDLETFHVFGTIVTNQNYEMKKYIKKEKLIIKNRNEYLNTLLKLDEKRGINAMSISNMTGIPRATIIRKLKVLMNRKLISINNKKLYNLKSVEMPLILKAQKESVQRLAGLTTEIFNLAKFN